MSTRNKGIPVKKGKKGTPQPKRGPKKVAKTTAKKPAKRASKAKPRLPAKGRPGIEFSQDVQRKVRKGVDVAEAVAAKPAPPKSWWRRALSRVKAALHRIFWNG